MSLDELLHVIRQYRLILTYGAALWSPNVTVPGSVRSAIAQHRPALLHLIRQGDIRVCADVELHRKYWKHASGRYICEVCERITA